MALDVAVEPGQARAREGLGGGIMPRGLPVLGRPEAARTAATTGRPAWYRDMPDQTIRARWSDPGLRRAFALAIIAIVLLLLPIAFGAHPLGAPSFDLTLDPAGPLPF
jgi:hypothetical protein